MNRVKWLWGKMDIPYKKRHILALSISVITSGMLLINPALSAQLVDQVIIAGNTAPLIPLLMWMLGFKLAREGMRYLMVVCLEKSSQNVVLTSGASCLTSSSIRTRAFLSATGRATS